MGACATKPGDLKVKGEAPVVVEDAAAAPPPVAPADEKAKAGEVPVAAAAAAAAEVDHADVSRRRSLSVLLKQEAEASDGEADADHQETEKVVGVAEEELATAAGETTTGSPQAPPVEASVPTTEHDDTAQEPKNDDLPSDGGDAQAAEEEKRVDPESIQVAVTAVGAETDSADAPSSEESRAAVADADSADAPISEERKVAVDDDASA